MDDYAAVCEVCDEQPATAALEGAPIPVCQRCLDAEREQGDIPEAPRGPLRLRASAMPLAMICPASVRPDGLRVDPVTEAAESGTKLHHALERIAIGATPDLDGLDSDERAAVFAARRLYERIAPSLSGIETERSMMRRDLDGARLTGHCDVLGRLSDGTIAIVDWKTGHLRADVREQLRAYCVLALYAYPDANRAVAWAIWPRDGEIDPAIVMSQIDATDWRSRVERDVVRWDGVYRPGPHCSRCVRSAGCPGRAGDLPVQIRSLMEQRLDRLPADLRVLREQAPHLVHELRRRASDLSKVAEAVKSAIGDEVRSGGPISDGAGRELIALETRRRVVDVLPAWPALVERFTAEELARAVRVSLGDLEDALAAGAARGAKGAAIAELRAALEAAGAVRTVNVARVIERAEKPQAAEQTTEEAA